LDYQQEQLTHTNITIKKALHTLRKVTGNDNFHEELFALAESKVDLLVGVPHHLKIRVKDSLMPVKFHIAYKHSSLKLHAEPKLTIYASNNHIEPSATEFEK
jgi:hypothetical protein